MIDIIERLWIAHGELPGRQLLMRDAIAEIESVRAARDERVSVELLNIERATCDRIRSDNDCLRAQLNACRSSAGDAVMAIGRMMEEDVPKIAEMEREITRLRDENANLAAACKIADRKNEALHDLLTAASGAHEFFSGVSFSDLAELTEANIHCERMEAAIKQAKARMKCP